MDFFKRIKTYSHFCKIKIYSIATFQVKSSVAYLQVILADFQVYSTLTCQSMAVLALVDHSCYFCRLFIVALWSAAWKGLTSCLSFVMSYCEFVTLLLVSWVRYGT